MATAMAAAAAAAARSVLAHGGLSVKYVSPAVPAVLLFSALAAGGPACVSVSTVERRGEWGRWRASMGGVGWGGRVGAGMDSSLPGAAKCHIR